MPILERLISTIAPYDCLGCGQEGSLLCIGCVSSSLQTPPARCYRCRAVSSGSKTCSKCRRVSRLGYVWVGAEYADLAEELVKKLKFERTQRATSPMSFHLAEALPVMPSEVILVHVPTATSRIRERGYDQARLLARDLAHELGLQHLPLLARSGQTRQVGTKRALRLKQLEQAFRAKHPNLIKGQHILLVDDVLTTGATLEVAAKVLKQAGAKKVDAVVFAQA